MLQIQKTRYPSFQLVSSLRHNKNEWMNEMLTYTLLVGRITVENVEFRHRVKIIGQFNNETNKIDLNFVNLTLFGSNAQISMTTQYEWKKMSLENNANVIKEDKAVACVQKTWSANKRCSMSWRISFTLLNHQYNMLCLLSEMVLHSDTTINWKNNVGCFFLMFAQLIWSAFSSNTTKKVFQTHEHKKFN